ncbi:hypothetical protein, partial [Ligilactobacillus salivarius]
MTFQLGKIDGLMVDTKYEYHYCIVTYIKSGLNDGYIIHYLHYDSLLKLERGYNAILDKLDNYDEFTRWVNTAGGAFHTRDIEYIAPLVAYNVPEGEDDEGAYKDCLDFNMAG